MPGRAWLRATPFPAYASALDAQQGINQRGLTAQGREVDRGIAPAAVDTAANRDRRPATDTGPAAGTTPVDTNLAANTKLAADRAEDSHLPIRSWLLIGLRIATYCRRLLEKREVGVHAARREGCYYRQIEAKRWASANTKRLEFLARDAARNIT